MLCNLQYTHLAIAISALLHCVSTVLRISLVPRLSRRRMGEHGNEASWESQNIITSGRLTGCQRRCAKRPLPWMKKRTVDETWQKWTGAWHGNRCYTTWDNCFQELWERWMQALQVLC